MNKNPRIAACIEEIKKTLDKYDMMGIVNIADGLGNGEYLNNLDRPAWSNFRFIKSGKGIHLKAYSKTDKENTDRSINGALLLFDLQHSSIGMMKQVSEMIENRLNIEKSKGEFY